MTAAIHSAAWFALLVFLVSVPASGVWVTASGHDFARSIQIGVCLFCAIELAIRRAPREAGRHTLPVLCAVFTLAIASTVLAPVLSMAARELTLTLGLVAVTCVVARRTSEGSATTQLLTVVSVAGAAYAALTGVGLLANLAAADRLRPYDLLIGYDNGRFFNHVQTSMLPLLALATVQPFGNRWFKRLAAFGLAVGIALLVLSEGRATVLALLAGGVAGLGLFRRAAWPIVRSFFLAGGLAVVIYTVFFVVLPHLCGMSVEGLHVDGTGDTASASSRLILWQIAAEGIERSPWLGIGPMHFSHTWNPDAAHPHNIYLQVAEEWGLPMALLLIGIAGIGLRRLCTAVRRHRGDSAERILGAGLFMTAIAIGVDGLLSGNFVMPVSQMWIAVVIGAAWGWVRRNASVGASSTAPASVLGRVFRLLPLVAMCWLTTSTAPEIARHLFVRSAPLNPSTVFEAPRFWANGWF